MINATMTLIIVPGMNGIKPITVADAQLISRVILSHVMPNAYKSTLPIMIPIKSVVNDGFNLSVRKPIEATRRRYPNKKPPVGPKRKANPEAPLEKTGIPSIPKARYKATLNKPYFPPRKRPESITKKSANTIGTGPTGIGILIYAPMIISAVNRAQ